VRWFKERASVKRMELEEVLAGRDRKILGIVAGHFFGTHVTPLEGGRWLLAETHGMEETVLDDDQELIDEILAYADDAEEG
jgi:hypothetical protein